MAFLSFPITIPIAQSASCSVDCVIAAGDTNPASANDIVGGFRTETVTFAAGETAKNLIVQIAADTTVEPDEQIKVTLANPLPSGASIAAGVGVGIIVNDDGGPTTISMGSAADTGYVNAGTRFHRFETTLQQSSLAGEYPFVANSTGSEKWFATSQGTSFVIQRLSGGSVGDLDSFAAPAFSAGDVLGIDVVNTGSNVQFLFSRNGTVFHTNTVDSNFAATTETYVRQEYKAGAPIPTTPKIIIPA